MKNFATFNLLLILLLALPSYGDVVTVAFGDKLQPFCFPETQTGIHVDIIREALAFKGHTMNAEFYPIKRVPRVFITNKLDGAMMDSDMDLRQYGGIYAEPAVLYDNVFISLKSRNIQIHKPEDLKNLSVLAFPGALERYPEWLGAVSKEGHYFESNEQPLQVLALLRGRYDVVLSDRHIFRYFKQQYVKNEKVADQKIVEHDFVKPNPKDYQTIFRSKQIAQDYEVGLKHLKKTGRYEAIFRRYLK
ncbi:substrate-binding periplasmic protein [Bdellovibrio sp. HCB337]|uniref:substrate-binding periplasmic protein n=1 Tax=Bdellovibrio sp. HCB337 TaxID=3394358 RepID=UPI0039A4B86E